MSDSSSRPEVRPLYAYLDTNVLLEFRPLWENDWRRLLGVEHIVLVISDVVFGELQDIKDGVGDLPRRKRDRAHGLMKKLEQQLFPDVDPTGAQPVIVRDGVRLFFDSKAPPPELLSRHHLDPTRGDSRLLGVILAARLDGRDACLVTNDISARARAKSQGIHCYDLPDALKLQEEPDPTELENRKLRQKVLAYESRMPKLGLGFSSGEHPLRITVPLPRTSAQKDSLFQAYCYQHPFWAERSLVHRIYTDAAAFGSPSQSAIDRYDDDVGRFRKEVEQLLPALLNHADLMDLYVPLTMVLRNDGTSPAEDVELAIVVPDGVVLTTELPKPPREPTPPELPRSPISAVTVLSIRIREQLEEERARLFDAGRVSFEPEWDLNGSQAGFSKRKIKHGQGVVLPKLYAVLPSRETAASFGVVYKIHADNVVEPVEGRLDVVVHKDSKPGGFKALQEQTE